MEFKKMMTLYKEKLLLGIVSCVCMVFQFLLAKQFLFLHGFYLFKLVIPLVFVGYAAGTILIEYLFPYSLEKEKYPLLRGYLLLSIAVSLYAVSLLMAFFARHAFHGVWVHIGLLSVPFLCIGLYFGNEYRIVPDIRNILCVSGIGFSLGSLAAGKLFKYLGYETGVCILAALLVCVVVWIAHTLLMRLLALVFLFFLFFLWYFNFLSIDTIVNPSFCFFGLHNKTVILRTEHTEMARTDLVRLGDRFSLFTDGDAPTVIVHAKTLRANIHDNVAGFPYIPYLLGSYERVLIIGTGGGIDLYQALLADAHRVVGVELNPVIIKIMKKDLLRYSGGVYIHPRVTIVNEEGRAFVHNTKEQFDLIVLQGTDTLTMSSFVSSTNLESYLYTKEALAKYREILSDHGALFISRVVPMAYEKRGMYEIAKVYENVKGFFPHAETDQHIMVCKSFSVNEWPLVAYSIFISKASFPENIYGRVANFPHRVIPLHKVDRIGRSQQVPRDNCPSFYVFDTPQKGMRYIVGIMGVLFLCALGIIVFHRGIQKDAGWLFLLLGIGYMGIEITLTEIFILFLRNPALSLQVVVSSFLLCGTLGAYWGARQPLSSLPWYAGAIGILCVGYIGVHQLLPVFSFSAIPRWIIAFILTAPLGFFASIPYAGYLNYLTQHRHIYNGIDAIGTVIGTLLIFFLHTYFGFTAGLVFLCGLYIVIATVKMKSYSLI